MGIAQPGIGRALARPVDSAQSASAHQNAAIGKVALIG